MAWCIIYDKVTGEQISEASDRSLCAPDDILEQKGYAVLMYGPDRPDYAANRWDTKKRAMVQKVVIDRLDDLVSDSSIKSHWDSMTPTQQAVTRVLMDHVAELGRTRFDSDDPDVKMTVAKVKDKLRNL